GAKIVWAQALQIAHPFETVFFQNAGEAVGNRQLREFRWLGCRWNNEFRGFGVFHFQYSACDDISLRPQHQSVQVGYCFLAAVAEFSEVRPSPAMKVTQFSESGCVKHMSQPDRACEFL